MGSHKDVREFKRVRDVERKKRKGISKVGGLCDEMYRWLNTNSLKLDPNIEGPYE